LNVPSDATSRSSKSATSKALARQTITEADDHLFCMITMNHHPLHTNAWFAEHETVHHKNVVVGTWSIPWSWA